MLAGAQDLEQRHHRRHAAPEEQAARGAFEIGEDRLGLLDGRPAITRIDVALPRGIAFVAGERARQLDPRHDGPGAGIDMAQGLGDAGRRGERNFWIAAHTDDCGAQARRPQGRRPGRGRAMSQDRTCA